MHRNQKKKQKSGLLNDLATENDYLGFAPYVEAVANFLCDEFTSPPLTLSIDGEWGSGKSSFLKQLRKKISTKIHPFYCIEFNPWRYNENEALWAAFAIELERKLYKTAPFYIRWIYKISQYKWKKMLMDLSIKLLPAIAVFLFAIASPSSLKVFHDPKLIKTLLLWSATIYALFPAKEELLKVRKKLSTELLAVKLKDYANERPDYHEKAPFLDKFHEDIQKLVKGLAGKNRVFVFVDDLDRCSPSQAVELIQSINLLIADELKLFFILAVDSKKIAAGIANKYKDDLPLLTEKEKELSYSEMLNFGYEYLDKFIQISFKMPSPQLKNIDEYFFHLVNDSIESENINISFFSHNLGEETSIAIDFQEFTKNSMHAISYMAAQFLQNNPRKLKKFFNLFKFYIFLGSQIGLFGVKEKEEQPRITVPQLAKLLLLNYRWPKVLEICRIEEDFLNELAVSNYIDIEKWNAAHLFPQEHQEKSEALFNVFKEFLKNSDLMMLIKYGSGQDTNLEKRYTDPFPQKDWSLVNINLLTFLEVSPTYTSEIGFSPTESAPSSMPA